MQERNAILETLKACLQYIQWLTTQRKFSAIIEYKKHYEMDERYDTHN